MDEIFFDVAPLDSHQMMSYIDLRCKLDNEELGFAVLSSVPSSDQVACGLGESNRKSEITILHLLLATLSLDTHLLLQTQL